MKKKIMLIAVFFLIIDLVTKIVIDNYLDLNESITIIPGFFHFTKIYNDGASWSLFSGHPLILILVTFIILVILLIYQYKFIPKWRNAMAFGLLYGGIIGNLIDRMLYGYVIDFLDFKIFNFNYPVFNIADIGIVIGILLLIIAIFKKEDECGNSSK